MTFRAQARAFTRENADADTDGSAVPQKDFAVTNVVQLHGEGSWPHTIQKLERDIRIYQEIVACMVDVAENLRDTLAKFSHEFFVNEVDKLLDVADDAIRTARRTVTE